MKPVSAILFFLFLLNTALYSQSPGINDYVAKGIELHDKGEYAPAVEQFKKALAIDGQSPLANYEIANTYFVMKKYQLAIDHGSLVKMSDTAHAPGAAVLVGSAHDLLGERGEAIKVYKAAIKKYPSKYLLHYNLALTYFNQQAYEESEKALQNALLNNPGHASSHLLMAYTMGAKNRRPQSLFAAYNFLLLEPKSARSADAFKLLTSLAKSNVKKDADNKVTISFSPGAKNDPFSPIDLSLSLMEAAGSTAENRDKTVSRLFAENTNTFFSIAGELKKKKDKDFWWTFYVDFFYALTKEGHSETLAYYISQSKDDSEVKTWLASNQEKIDKFSKWYGGYERK